MQILGETIKMTYQGNDNQNKTGIAILISDKVHFKRNNTIKNGENHYIMFKALIDQKL